MESVGPQRPFKNRIMGKLRSTTCTACRVTLKIENRIYVKRRYVALSCGTSCDTQAQDGVSHEVVGEGPRRIIFDLENISEHEKAAGAKSEGLTLGPCCDYNKGKLVLLCDLEIVFLVLLRLRTSEVRELQAMVSHQGLVIMGGNAAVATAMADHWKAEREAKPSNVLLQFLGAAVEHEAAQASGADAVDNARATDDNVQESIVRALVPALERALDQAVSVRLGGVAKAFEAKLDAAVRELARPQVNINTSARRVEDLQQINVDAPQTAQEEAHIRSTTAPTSKFLRGLWRPEWTRRGFNYTSVALHFPILLQAGKQSRMLANLAALSSITLSTTRC